MALYFLHRRNWLISTIALLALMPLQARADHDLDYQQTISTAQQLHEGLGEFAQRTREYAFPPYELRHIDNTVRQACRVVERLESHAPCARVRADYNALKCFMRTIDRRLHRRCRVAVPHLMQCWRELQNDMATLGCLINGCPSGCSIHTEQLPLPSPPLRDHGLHRGIPDRWGLGWGVRPPVHDRHSSLERSGRPGPRRFPRSEPRRFDERDHYPGDLRDDAPSVRDPRLRTRNGDPRIPAYRNTGPRPDFASRRPADRFDETRWLELLFAALRR